MEYEFMHDRVNGGYHAKFSEEHELFGRWLLDEVGDDVSNIDQVLDTATNLNGQGDDTVIRGKEISLSLNHLDALVNHNIAQSDSDLALAIERVGEPLSVDENGMTSACGLTDFTHMMKEWRDFVSN
ncbi:YacL family protein [Algicola sagamiensis]|uniref:UPF0231 family protein n=1 Tax=Algicola sagamiensis TaxID=163869 RepID=UPI00146F901C|nr:YacL family protein [Algicola sagamiensis]